MFMRIACLVPITLAVCLTFGCHRAHRAEDSKSNDPTQTQMTGFSGDCVWEAAQETLRRQGYKLDRVDREAGVITTLPETSKHFFEFWRHDVDTRADFWEATFIPMRRWIEVTIGSAAHASEVNVVVHKEQLSSLDRQFNSSGAALQYFGENLPSTTGKEKITAEDDRWIDRGRDPAMEQYVLAAIRKQLSEAPG